VASKSKATWRLQNPVRVFQYSLPPGVSTFTYPPTKNLLVGVPIELQASPKRGCELLEDQRTLRVGDLEIEIGFDVEKHVAAAHFSRTSEWRDSLTVAQVASMLRNAQKWKDFREAFTILMSGSRSVE